METAQTQISYKDLGILISSFYFGGDQDFTYTEDLIDFLTNEDNSENFAVLTTTKPK